MTGYAGLASCVHCGFCLPSCPTYVATGDEADSPRGRIVLMRRLADGTLGASDPYLRHHLDRCLGCRGCEPVCPSGVAYGPALETARDALAAVRPPPPLVRALLHVMATPGLRRFVLAIARLLRPFAGHVAGWGRLGFAAGMLAGTRPRRIDGSRRDHPAVPPSRRPAVVIFLGCIQRELFAHVNDAAGRTLVVNAFALVRAPAQGCCGALHAHAGQLEMARVLARRNVTAFAQAPDALIAVTAAGCGAMLRQYGELLASDPLATEARAFAARVRDVTELLAERGPVPGGTLPVRVAYDAPCHLIHAQRVSDPPLAVLHAVPDLHVVPHDEPEACCGSAGIYALVERDLSHAVLERKVDALRAAAPDLVVTGNPGCAMQIAAGLRAAGRATPVVHPVEVLDAAYARAGRYAVPAVDSRGP